MKTFRPRGRRLALPILLFASVVTSSAHDPGISSTRLRMSSGFIVATMTLENQDIAAVKAVGGGPDPFASALSVTADGEPLPPLRVERSGDDGHHTRIDFQFASPASASLAVTVNLLAALARGHKHHLEVYDESGRLLVDGLLGAGAATLAIPRGPD
ncbi:MAG: hypothetical protein ABR538_17910 [Candidatus Binatia bacterium]